MKQIQLIEIGSQDVGVLRVALQKAEGIGPATLFHRLQVIIENLRNLRGGRAGKPAHHLPVAVFRVHNQSSPVSWVLSWSNARSQRTRTAPGERPMRRATSSNRRPWRFRYVKTSR